MAELAGKTALVTGSARRVGKAIALGLAREGVNVVMHYLRSEEEAKKLGEELTGLGVKSWLIRGDFSEGHGDLIDRAIEYAGKIDLLVNNASIFTRDKELLEDIDRNMRVNAFTPLMLGNRLFEREGRGSIVNILDTRIIGCDFDHLSYYLSKKTLEALTRCMALKFAPNVAVNGVAPGLILPPPGKDYSYLDQLKDTVPLRRHGSVDDVVEATIFLLKSEFITGQVVYVDGGKHLIQTIEGV